MNTQNEFVNVTHTFALVKWFKPPHLELSSFQIAAKYTELCSCELVCFDLLVVNSVKAMISFFMW